MRIVCGDGGGGNAASMLPLSEQNICTNQILFESVFVVHIFEIYYSAARPADSLKIRYRKKEKRLKSEAR